MPHTIQAIQAMSKIMRCKGDTMGLLAFPVLAFIASWQSVAALRGGRA